MIEHFASYKRAVFSRADRDKCVEAMCDKLTLAQTKVDFYALAGTGQSGVMAAIVAHELGLDYMSVRRSSEHTSHDSTKVAGVFRPGGYMFVDDLIDSGETLRHVVRTIAAEPIGCDPETGFEIKSKPVLVGACLYKQAWADGNFLSDFVSEIDCGKALIWAPQWRGNV